MTGETQKLPNWKHRGGAYLIDSAIFLSFWTVIDNILYWPLPDYSISLLSITLFCIYFLVFEGCSVKAASPGKRLFKIRVVRNDEYQLSIMDVLARSLIVGVLEESDTYHIALLFLQTPVATIVVLILGAAQVSLILYNISLCRNRWDYLMLQDRWTKTRVIAEKSKNISTYPQLKLIPHLIGLSIVFLIISTGSLSVAYHIDRNFWRIPWGIYSGQSTIQRSINHQLGLRTRATIKTSWQWTANIDTKKKYLEIELWIPYICWNDNSIKEYSEVALKSLKEAPIDLQGYSGVRLILSTGGLFSFSKSTEIGLQDLE